MEIRINLIITLTLIIFIITCGNERESLRDYKYRIFAQKMIKHCSYLFGKNTAQLNVYIDPVCNKIKYCNPIPECELDDDTVYYFHEISLQRN